MLDWSLFISQLEHESRDGLDIEVKAGFLYGELSTVCADKVQHASFRTYVGLYQEIVCLPEPCLLDTLPPSGEPRSLKRLKISVSSADRFNLHLEISCP
jgi:hypothetical protein